MTARLTMSSKLLAGEIETGDVRPLDRRPFSWMYHRIDLRNGHTGDTGTSSGIALDLDPHEWFCPVHPWVMLIRIMSARGYNEAGGRSYCRVCLRAKLWKAVERVRDGLSTCTGRKPQKDHQREAGIPLEHLAGVQKPARPEPGVVAKKANRVTAGKTARA